MSYDPKLPACPLCEGRPQVIRCEDGPGYEVFCGCGLSKRADHANSARMDWVTLCGKIRDPSRWQRHEDYRPDHIVESRQAASPGLAAWIRDLSAGQAVNKPRTRVKAGREVIP